MSNLQWRLLSVRHAIHKSMMFCHLTWVPGSCRHCNQILKLHGTLSFFSSTHNCKKTAQLCQKEARRTLHAVACSSSDLLLRRKISLLGCSVEHIRMQEDVCSLCLLVRFSKLIFITMKNLQPSHHLTKSTPPTWIFRLNHVCFQHQWRIHITIGPCFFQLFLRLSNNELQIFYHMCYRHSNRDNSDHPDRSHTTTHVSQNGQHHPRDHIIHHIIIIHKTPLCVQIILVCPRRT